VVKSSRCAWCGDKPPPVAHLDLERGLPIDDRDELFERLLLEGTQAGLSLINVLKERELMREPSPGVSTERIARQRPELIEEWLTHPASPFRHDAWPALGTAWSD
jgi:DNA-3-methyladenine glycosylase I